MLQFTYDLRLKKDFLSIDVYEDKLGFRLF